MPVTYTYPSNQALIEISQNLIQVATMDDPIFKLFPIRNRNASRLRWTIKDDERGLMGLRGMGGEPTSISRLNRNMYEAIPGIYGEFGDIDELEMTNLAAGIPPNVTIPVSVDGLVAEEHERLILREVLRMKVICWLLAVNNTFSVPLPRGGIGHTDSYTGQTATVSPLWSSTSSATPIKNLRDLQAAYGRGTSNSFMGTSEAWMNSVTANYLLANTNANDLGGKRGNYGATISSITGINEILLLENVPKIMIWDDGYKDDTGTFQLYIPDGKVLVVGARPGGETPGEFQITRNANNPNQEPGPYDFIRDFTTGPLKSVPPRIEVHRGFNGGPVMERPGQLITLTVA